MSSSPIIRQFIPSLLKAAPPFEMEMSAIEKTRRTTALDNVVVLNPKDPSLPIVTFKVHQFVSYINAKVAEKLPHMRETCWLKGSWTNEQEKFPNDVDITLIATDPNWKNQIIAMVGNFLALHADKSHSKGQLASQMNRESLPSNEYFDFIEISRLGKEPAFLSFKAYGFDFTVFRDPLRWSFGPMDGKWLQCEGDKKRHSMGTAFAIDKAQFDFGQFCIDHHINHINDPASAHNLFFRAHMEVTRKACLVDMETSRVVSHFIYQGKPVEVFSNQWIKHQHDHYKFNASKVIEFLNLLNAYQYSHFGVAYIARAWLSTSLAQNISGMKELIQLIVECPKAAPHILVMIQCLLLAEGHQAYNFDFRRKDAQLLPFVSIPVNDQINYLSLPNKQNSPAQMAETFLESLNVLNEIAKNFEERIGFHDLSFLTETFRHLNLNIKYLGKDRHQHLAKDLQIFFRNEKTAKIQSLFGPIKFDSLLTRLNELSERLPTDRPAGPQFDDQFENQLFEFETVIKDLNNSSLNNVSKLLRHFLILDSTKIEQDAKKFIDIFHNLAELSIEITGDKKKQKDIGCYFEDFLGQILPNVFVKVLKFTKPSVELFEKALHLYMTASEKNVFTEAQESIIVGSLIEAWKILAPPTDSLLYKKGCDLICHAFKKNLLGEKENLVIAFEYLTKSKNTEHLLMAHSKCNEAISFLNEADIIKMMKPLLQNCIENGSAELLIPMYQSLVNLYKKEQNHSTFYQLMQIDGIHRGPAIVKGIQVLLSSVQSYEEDILLLDLMTCILESQPSPDAIKTTLQSYDCFVKKQAAVKLRREFNYPLEMRLAMGLLAREFLKMGIPIADPLLDQWIWVTSKLISVTDHQSKSHSSLLDNHFRELGEEIQSLLLLSSADQTAQKKIQEITSKDKVVTKIEVPKSATIEKVTSSIENLLCALSSSGEHSDINEIIFLSKTILADLKNLNTEKLAKDLHSKLILNLAKAQCGLANCKQLETVDLAYKIFVSAQNKGLVISENLHENALWIVKCLLAVATSEKDIKWTAKMLPLIDHILNACAAGKKTDDDTFDVVIEVLGRLAKDSIQDQVKISNYLIGFCKCKLKKTTREFLINTVCNVVGDLSMLNNEISYDLAMFMFGELIRHSSKEEWNQDRIQVFQELFNYLDPIWFKDEKIEHLLSFLKILYSTGYLRNSDETIQLNIIAAIHKAFPAKLALIWELIQHVSNGDVPKSYDLLLDYLSTVKYDKKLNASTATLLGQHLPNAKPYWKDSGKMQLANANLIIIYTMTGHPIYMQKAFQAFADQDFHPTFDFAMKYLDIFTSIPLGVMNVDTAKEFGDVIDRICKDYMSYKDERETVTTKLLKIADKYLDGSNPTIYDLSIGIAITQNLINISALNQRKIHDPILITILEKIIFGVSKKKSYALILPIIQKAGQVCNDDDNEYLAALISELLIVKFVTELLAKFEKASPIGPDIQNVFNELKLQLLPFFVRFPEAGRMHLPSFIRCLLKKKPILSLSMSKLMDSVDAGLIYNQFTDDDFTTRKATVEEQVMLNKERQHLEKFIFEEMILNVNKRKKSHDEILTRLIRINRWAYLDTIIDVKYIISLHYMYANTVLNRSYIQGDEEEFQVHASEMDTFMTTSLNSFKSDKTLEKLAICRTYLLFVETLCYRFTFLPIIFKCLDKEAIIRKWSNEERHEIFRDMSIHSPQELIQIIKNSALFKSLFDQWNHKYCKKFNSDAEQTEMIRMAMSGLTLMSGNDDYKSVLNDKNILMANQMSLSLFRTYLDYTKELINILGGQDCYSKQIEKEKAILMYFVQFCGEINLPMGPGKQDFKSAGMMLRCEFNIKSPLDFPDDSKIETAEISTEERSAVGESKEKKLKKHKKNKTKKKR